MPMQININTFESQLGAKLKEWSLTGNTIKMRKEYLVMSGYSVRFIRHTGTAVGHVYSVGFRRNGRPAKKQHRIAISAPHHGMAWCVIIAQ